MALTFDIDHEALDITIDAALKEDGAGADVTVDYLGIGEAKVVANILAAAEGIVAGTPVAERVFRRADDRTEFETGCGDGAAVRPGDRIATVRGRAAGVLGAERVALNFLQRLSGIATLTARFAARVQPRGIRILDTRKTTPLLRPLERYAVRAGGGSNHRFNLSDMILIKENHIRAAGGPDALRKRLERSHAGVPVEVEVDSLACLQALLGGPVDRIMLDNFPPDDIRKAIEMVRSHAPAFTPEIEVSGGVTLANIDAYTIDGVDFISIGAVTHSAPAFDISMEVLDDAG